MKKLSQLLFPMLAFATLFVFNTKANDSHKAFNPLEFNAGTQADILTSTYAPNKITCYSDSTCDSMWSAAEQGTTYTFKVLNNGKRLTELKISPPGYRIIDIGLFQEEDPAFAKYDTLYARGIKKILDKKIAEDER